MLLNIGIIYLGRMQNFPKFFHFLQPHTHMYVHVLGGKKWQFYGWSLSFLWFLSINKREHILERLQNVVTNLACLRREINLSVLPCTIWCWYYVKLIMTSFLKVMLSTVTSSYNSIVYCWQNVENMDNLTIMFIIFWDFLMVEKFSFQYKWDKTRFLVINW